MLKNIVSSMIAVFFSFTAIAGQSTGIESLKDKLLLGQELTASERLTLLNHIERLEKPVVVGTANDTILFEGGKVFRFGSPLLMENEIVDGEEALRMFEAH
ncbi:MAG: hypothetical protein ACOH5I_15315 [Oligoflexus sp.]